MATADACASGVNRIETSHDENGAVNGNTMSTASSHAFTQARKRQCTMSAELQGTCRRSALQKHLIFFGMMGGRAWRSHKNANHRS